MSSGNLFKRSFITVKDDDARVINSNDLIADKMHKLAEILEMDSDEAFADEFSLGLDAEQVEALLGDREDPSLEEGLPESGNVIKEPPKANIDEIIEQANEEAARILDEAGAQAKKVLDDAAMEAEALKGEAMRAGEEAGYQEGLRRAEEEYSMKEADLSKKEEALEQEYKARYDELETRLVKDLTEVYEHVLGVNLSDQTEVIINLMKDAIKNIEGGRNFFVHVSAGDYAYVSAFKEDILNSVGGVDSVEIVEDVTLKPSDCFVECESGIYECGLGTELSLLKKELRLLSYRPAE